MHMKMVVLGIESTCFIAAENGHLECLKYAHENGCPGYKKYIKNDLF